MVEPVSLRTIKNLFSDFVQQFRHEDIRLVMQFLELIVEEYNANADSVYSFLTSTPSQKPASNSHPPKKTPPQLKVEQVPRSQQATPPSNGDSIATTRNKRKRTTTGHQDYNAFGLTPSNDELIRMASVSDTGGNDGGSTYDEYIPQDDDLDEEDQEDEVIFPLDTSAIRRPSAPGKLCPICEFPADKAGFCENCRVFVKRKYFCAEKLECMQTSESGGPCDVTGKNRYSCDYCRLQKCIKHGLKGVSNGECVICRTPATRTLKGFPTCWTCFQNNVRAVSSLQRHGKLFDKKCEYNNDCTLENQRLLKCPKCRMDKFKILKS